MKKFITVLALATAIAATATLAAAKYVTEQLEVTLRAGPGLDYKIIAMIPAGAKLDVNEDSGGYARVSYHGKEGWVVGRFLVDEPPKGPQLEPALKRLEEAKAELDTARGEVKELQSELNATTRKLKSTSDELDKVTREFEKWKGINSQVLDLKADRDKLDDEARSARTEMEKLQLENRQLKGRSNIYWFVSGAVVIVLGWILGLVFAGARNRPRSGGYRF